jgi:hypothetical protein
MRDPKGRYVPGEPEHPDHRFKPGQSGNPAGRPRGSRSKLLERVVDDFHFDWVANGVEVIATLRRTRPADYVRAVIAILPKDIRIEHANDMTDDELLQRILQLAGDLGLTLGGAGDASEPAAHEAPPGPQPAGDVPPLH